jgi:hypothetical protein
MTTDDLKQGKRRAQFGAVCVMRTTDTDAKLGDPTVVAIVKCAACRHDCVIGSSALRVSRRDRAPIVCNRCALKHGDKILLQVGRN